MFLAPGETLHGKHSSWLSSPTGALGASDPRRGQSRKEGTLCHGPPSPCRGPSAALPHSRPRRVRQEAAFPFRGLTRHLLTSHLCEHRRRSPPGATSPRRGLNPHGSSPAVTQLNRAAPRALRGDSSGHMRDTQGCPLSSPQLTQATNSSKAGRMLSPTEQSRGRVCPSGGLHAVVLHPISRGTTGARPTPLHGPSAAGSSQLGLCFCASVSSFFAFLI